MTRALATLTRDFAHSTRALVILLCVLLSAGIFIADVTSPLGVAAGVPYVAVVLISLWLPRWQYTISFAACASILTILGFFVSEPAAFASIVVANRILALGAIWLTALAGIWLVHARRRKSEEALQQAMRDADRARNVKSRFLGTANDYLRQRLQTLSLLNGTLRKVVTEASAQEIFAMQHGEVLELTNLLDSLLEITELDSGEVEVKVTETPILEIFRRLKSEFRRQAQAKGLELRFESETAIACSDRTLLTQILRNLVSNAIRYTDRGGVRVRCRREARGLRITVEDSGIGIAPDQLSSIFDEFYRVENGLTNRSGSFGLGLSIVERTAKLLGTTIEAESEVGRGSSFSLLVPAAD